MSYKVYLDKTKVSVGDNVRLFTEIINRKIIPIPWIKLEVEIPIEFSFNNTRVQLFDLNRNLFTIISSLLFFEKLKRYDSFKCTKRGVYKLKTAEITIGDFFGVAKANFEIKVSKDLIVHPKIKDLIEFIDIPRSLQGDISVKRWIVSDPTQIVGVRKYVNSDSFNTIDWKASAKHNDLYVKKLDFTSEPKIMTFLDVQTEDIHWKGINYDLIEIGIDIIASLLDKALKEKISIGYTSNTVFEDESEDVFIYPSNASNQKGKILDALAKTTYRKTYDIKDLINNRISCLGKECSIILLLSYIAPEFIKTLNHYARCGYNIKIILLNNKCNLMGLNGNIDIKYLLEKGDEIFHVQ